MNLAITPEEQDSLLQELRDASPDRTKEITYQLGLGRGGSSPRATEGAFIRLALLAAKGLAAEQKKGMSSYPSEDDIHP